jgi:cell division protein FtsI/penicillin-binding protein 2
VGLTFATKKPRRFWRPRTFVIGVVVIALVGAGVFVLANRSSGSSSLPTREVDMFLHAWSNGDTATMGTYLDTPPSDFATMATSLIQSAPGSRAQYSRTTLLRDQHGSGATATYHARLDLAGFGAFEWDGTLALARVKQGETTAWRVMWSPSVLYPGLAAGQHLTLQRVWPTRAAITASDGSLLSGPQSVVMIGLEPDRVATTLPQIKQLLHTLVGTDPASIDAALHAPGVRPNYFVPIATVPDDARYTTVLRPRLAPIAGVFFQRTRGVLAPTDAAERQLVGTVGEITAQRLKQLGPPYQVGDKVGLSGLQAAFETRLAGRPVGDVVVVGGASKPLRIVKHFPGRAAQGVIMTLDPHVQAAAEAALSAVTLPAALVALDTRTGQIRAVVSKPDNGFPRALAGGYPPGSTFKVITSTALLAAGRTGATPAPCPPTLVVDGRSFKNFEGEASGALDLAQAFKISCNNAFIGLADQLPANALARAAVEYGFNVPWSLPILSLGGSYPTPRDAAERAGSAIGQGRVLASPVQMASVAAAVASGRWRAPALTSAPAPSSPTVPALPPAIDAMLRAFMATVVQPGGTAGNAGLPPGVLGKTGTAEFGNANPPRTHAWFIGFRGNLAFAVIVEGGGVGGQVAAPLAAKFLNALPA